MCGGRRRQRRPPSAEPLEAAEENERPPTRSAKTSRIASRGPVGPPRCCSPPCRIRGSSAVLQDHWGTDRCSRTRAHAPVGTSPVEGTEAEDRCSNGGTGKETLLALRERHPVSRGAGTPRGCSTV